MVGLQAYTLHVAEKHVTSNIMRCQSIEPGMDFPFNLKLSSLSWQFSIKDLQVIYTEMFDKRQHSMMKSAKREKKKHAEQENLVYMHRACIREIVKNERDTIKRRHRAISWASLFDLSQFLLWAFI